MWSRVWSGWKMVVERVGAFQAKVVLTLLYFVLIAPFALFVKLGRNRLRIGRVATSNWTARTVEPSGLEASRRQF